MRRSREEADRTRQQIVAAASRLFRARGVAQVSVADVMSAVGLTVGGFYRHFASKEALVGEAIEAASHETIGHLAKAPTGARRLSALLESYLSQEHRRDAGRGCPIAALCSDAGREGRPTRAAFTAALRRMLALVGDALPGSLPSAREAQLHAAAAAVGAVVLARATDDDDLAQEILTAVRRRIPASLPDVGSVSKARPR